MLRQKYKTLFPLDRHEQDFRYAASVGHLRVLEERFLKKEDFLRLATPGLPFSDKLTTLNQAGYGSSDNVEVLISKARDKQDVLLKELSRDSGLAEFLLMDLDYQNLKSIIRFLLLQQQEWEIHAEGAKVASVREQSLGNLEKIPSALRVMLRETGNIDTEKLYEAVLNRMRGQGAARIPGARDVFCAHMQRVVEEAEKGHDLSAPDFLADKLYFEDLFAWATDREHKHFRNFALDYIRMAADLANFEIYFRLQRMKAPKSFLASVLLPHGDITEKEFLAAYEGEKNIEELFQVSPISEGFEGFPTYSDKGEIAAFGMSKDHLLLKLIRKGRRNSFSPEAIAGFWLMKKLERKNLRILFQALARGMKQEEIMVLLRPAFEEVSL